MECTIPLTPPHSNIYRLDPIPSEQTTIEEISLKHQSIPSVPIPPRTDPWELHVGYFENRWQMTHGQIFFSFLHFSTYFQ